MFEKISSILAKSLDIQFHLLFLLIPLVFFPHNYELFEFNKMLLVYLLTVSIVSTWLVRMIVLGKIQIPRTPLDIPIALILGSRTLSTIFSIDPHTSLWGYYSRFNEGFFSTLSYVLLFYVFVSHFNKRTKILNLIFTIFISSLLVALWGIPGHFGADVSCLLINHKLGVDCWQEEFNPLNRIYSTIGQPNWFAAFLAFTLPLGVGYIILSQAKIIKSLVYVLGVAILYLAFTFAYSRGGTIGLLAGILTLLVGIIYLIKQKGSECAQVIKYSLPYLGLVLVAFVLINTLFGNALTARPITYKKLTSTQLETGGTESGQIRLVVWRGAFDIFRHYPILGSGLETFAYSYYLFRPVEHNLTSEWEYIYNKAHNEYLNTLSTTGSLGLLSLASFLLVFFYQFLKFIKNLRNPTFLILSVSLISGYISVLAQNVFGFSVVILSFLLFLTPAVIISSIRTLSDATNSNLTINLSFPHLGRLLRTSTILFILVVSSHLFIYFRNFWLADLSFSQANSYLVPEKIDKSILLYQKAINLRPQEPFYHSQLGLALAVKASSTEKTSSKELDSLIKEAIKEGESGLNLSPYNLSYHKNLFRIYMELGEVDSNYYKQAYEVMKKSLKIAPTDPKVTYNLALSLKELPQDNKEQLIEHLQQTLSLKPNWIEPMKTLALVYEESGDEQKALQYYKKILDLQPDLEGIKEKIENLNK